MLSNENVIQKIQKLLESTKKSKFESAESFKQREGEIAAATERAQELLKKYNLDLHEVEKREGKGTGVDVTQESILMDSSLRNMPFQWMVRLATGVGEVTQCDVLYYTVSRTLIFIGRPTSIEVAKVLYVYLRDQMKQMAEWAARSPSTNYRGLHVSAFKPAYLWGMACRVAERLQDSQKKSEVESSTYGALVFQFKDAIEKYKEESFGKIHTNKTQYRPNIHYFAISQGRKDGEKINLETKKTEIVR